MLQLLTINPPELAIYLERLSNLFTYALNLYPNSDTLRFAIKMNQLPQQKNNKNLSKNI